MKSNAHPCLLHLTKLEINELTKQYDAGTKITDLKKLFKLDCASNNLYRLLPPLIRDSDPCPNCGAAMTKPRPSRNHFIGTHAKKSTAWRCTECNHIDVSDCSCDSCQDRELRLTIAPETVCKRYSPDYPFHPHDLTLDQVVTVLALAICTCQENSDGISIQDRRRIKIPFAPDEVYGANLIKDLLRTNLIVRYHKHENLFSLEGSSFINQPSNTFSWNMPTTQRKELTDSILRHIEEENLSDRWVCQIYNIAHTIAIAECLAFYEWSSKQRKFAATARLSLTEMITTLLSDYSVSQCQYIINESAKAASDYFVLRSSDASSTAEFMLKHCKKLGAESKSNNVAIPNTERINALPRSVISHVFYNYFMPDVDDFTDTLDKVKNKIKTIN